MSLKVETMTPLIQVFDMPTSVAFYRDLLGFTVVNRSQPGDGDEFDWGLLRLDGALLMLNTAYERDSRPLAPDPARQAAHDDTGLFFSCPDVDAAYAYLREKGVDVKPPKIAPYGMKQLYVTDPDGYVLCFQWPAA
jgi:glyoxylase I family protein